jgi:hypothetical protein
MKTLYLDAPQPDLRIVATESLLPHEEHDSQRAEPLAERLSRESFMINPPVVAPLDGRWVILDGANRFHAFSYLEYPHILVQSTTYESGWVELGTWSHVIGHWSADALLAGASEIGEARLVAGAHAGALAAIVLPGGDEYALLCDNHSRLSAVARTLVSLYQRQAALHRTAIGDSGVLWDLYPDACAVVRFPSLQSQDILNAAKSGDFLPPGVSRHIVHGRAIRVNYPMEALRAPGSLDAKNAALLEWVRGKLANRQVRYYAEATYQFDE